MKKINYRKFSSDLRNCYELESKKSYTVRGAIDHLRKLGFVPTCEVVPGMKPAGKLEKCWTKPGTGFTAHIG